MPQLSLIHSVRLLPESISPCPFRDWQGKVEVTLNGGSVWHLPWSWFGEKTAFEPSIDRIEGLIISALAGTLNHVPTPAVS